MDQEQGFRPDEFEIIKPADSRQILVTKTQILEATGLNVDGFNSKLPLEVRKPKPKRPSEGISIIAIGDNHTEELAHFMVEIRGDAQQAVIELGDRAEQKSVTHEYIHYLHCAVNPELLGFWRETHEIDHQLRELKVKGQTPLDDCLRVADPEQFMKTDTTKHLETAGLEISNQSDNKRNRAQSLVNTLSEAHLYDMQAEIYKALTDSDEPTDVAQERLFQEVADDLYEGDTRYGFHKAPGGVGYHLRRKMDSLLEVDFDGTLTRLEAIASKFGLRIDEGYEFRRHITDTVLGGDPDSEVFDYQTAKERVARFIEASASYSELEQVRSTFGDDPEKLWEQVGEDFDHRDIRAAKDKLIEKVMSLDEDLARDRLGSLVYNMLEAKDKTAARKSILTTNLLLDADLPDDPMAREAMLANSEYIGELMNLVLSEENSPLTFLGLSPQEFLDSPREVVSLMQSRQGQLDEVDVSRLASLGDKLEGEYFGWGTDNMFAEVNRERIRSRVNQTAERQEGLFPSAVELESRRETMSIQAKLMVEPIAHITTSFMYGEPPLEYIAEGLGRIYSKAFAFEHVDIEKHVQRIHSLLEERNPQRLLAFLKQPTFADQVNFLKQTSPRRNSI